ncbi:MAG: hypothetical protein EOP48_31690 [Sphingobacteriales bacterium]|nr:MAG: hypothetical protein EOP48_31690 [Sphingobacteriales bacterium]
MKEIVRWFKNYKTFDGKGVNMIHFDDAVLEQKRAMPPFFMFDIDLFRGEMPIIGNIPLSEGDRQIPFPSKKATSLTVPFSKTDIEIFILAEDL